MQTPVLYTEKNDCQDCYKCVKECPTKSIKIEDSSASIMYDYCIYCGHCTQICPVGAKKDRDDMSRVKKAIAFGDRLIVSLAPSYISEFPGVSQEQLVTALKEVGFYAVSETALGAEKVAEETKLWIEQQPDGVYIGSSCPAAVEYIRKYHPDLTGNIVPLLSPMLTHAKLLKKLYGNSAKVVFIGPCIAKKNEADQFPDIIDYAVTFQRLKALFEEYGIEPAEMIAESDTKFVPQSASLGNLFPIDGGILATMGGTRSTIGHADILHSSYSGMHHIKEIIHDIPKIPANGKKFIELLVCEGGCIKGPATIDTSSVMVKRQRVVDAGSKQVQKVQNAVELFNGINISRNFNNIKPTIQCVYSEQDIQEALRSVNKFSAKDELNCNGCGYDTCRDFSIAILDGRAERSMCISYMRKVAQDKASVLLQKIPSGVVMVDDKLTVIDANLKFAELLGEEGLLVYEARPGMEGSDLRKLLPFHKLFTAVLDSGEEMVEQDIRDGDKFYHLSIVTIQKFKIVCGIIQDMHDPGVQKDIVLTRTQAVIEKNMEVVQQIAYLLGETASYTEAMLNSILESQKGTDDDGKK